MRRVLVAAVLLGLLSAGPAFGKGDVRARIEGRVDCKAAAGTTISVAWRLFSVEDGKREPFGAGGLFVRLRGSRGATSRAYGEGRAGRYRARVRVPRGGIRRLELGLDGWMITKTRRTYAPKLFPIENNPCA